MARLRDVVGEARVGVESCAVVRGIDFFGALCKKGLPTLSSLEHERLGCGRVPGHVPGDWGR